ncbi:MAG: GNAT family N-acetyltransferase [Enterobacterales bacterium]|nr:GNAT family N-acetyltransferase [Enterobacterales bacterium]
MLIAKINDNSPYISQIAALLHWEWSSLPRWSTQEGIQQRFITRNQPDSEEFTLVAYVEDGQLLGTASVIVHELDDRPERKFWLGEVFTPPEHRGKGVGSALTKACVAHAQEQGIKQLYLYTPDQQSLYLKLGWQEIEKREVSGEWVSVMSLNID